MKLADLFEQSYLSFNPNLSPRTVTLYRITLQKFADHCEEEPTLAQLTNEIVGKYLADLLESDLSPHTVEKERCQLLAIWRHAHTLGLVNQGPLIRKIVLPRKIPTTLTVAQLKRLQATFDELRGSTGGLPNSDVIRAVFGIQFTTAERVGAVAQLRRSDIGQNVVTFRAETRKGGRKSIVKQIPDWVHDDLDRIKEPVREFVFPDCSNTTKLNLLYSRLFDRAGVKRPKGKSSHLLRSTHATMLWMAGGNPTESLGHSSERVTKNHYIDTRQCPDRSHEILPDLSEDDAEDSAREEWLLRGRAIDQTSNGWQWIAGDWICEGVPLDRFRGESITLARSELKASRPTVWRWFKTASAFSPCRRRKTLSWTHHRDVSQLPEPDQEHWLDVADSEGLTIAQVADSEGLTIAQFRRRLKEAGNERT